MEAQLIELLADEESERMPDGRELEVLVNDYEGLTKLTILG